MVLSRHGTNMQFLQHINKAFSTVKKMGLVSPYVDAVEVLELKRQELKAAQCKLAEGTHGKSKAEKKTTASLLLKNEIISLKKKLTHLAHEIFQPCQTHH